MTIEASVKSWNTLYRIGGAAALTAGVIFRRNLGVEIALFSPTQPPDSPAGWFALLQANRLLGLAYLSIFDVVNYALLALMFLALFAALQRVNPSLVAAAFALAFLGIAAYLASNTALSLLALSERYAAAAEAQRETLLAAGQALLAMTRFGSSGAHPGSAGYISLLLVASAGMVVSVVMAKSAAFRGLTAYTGLLANGLDLAYCAAYLFAPAAGEMLAVMFLPAAGLLFMVWHILVGWKLFRLGKANAQS